MTTIELTSPAPSHVPPELVAPFDQLKGPEITRFPPTAALGIARERPVFYSSFYGGFWVLTRYEDVRAAFRNDDVFRQWSKGIPAAPFSKLYKPLYLDEPEHRVWRRVLGPIFAPRQLVRLESFVRDLALRQLALIGPHGHCDFIVEFADVLAGTVFCKQLGLPEEEYPRFSRMAHDLVYGPAQTLREGGDVAAARAARASVNAEIDALIAALIPERRRNPGEDIVSILLDAKVEGRPLTEEDVVSMTSLLFHAGTDSTRSAMTYAFIHLAQNPDLRDRLVAEPSLAAAATAELLRFHGFHLISRVVSRDVEFAGVTMKEGDLVLLSLGAANRDESKFAHADSVDFGRTEARTHLTFGAGVHRCIGSHLATLQLRVALEEFHRAITDYRLDPDAEPVRYEGGQGKAVPRNLPLVFTPVSP
jgi:cytochrome P450